MKKTRLPVSAATALAIVYGSAITLGITVPTTSTAGPVEDGKLVAFDRVKGNCLSCHAMADGALPGNIGPPLVNMKNRFPDKEKLRAQIWDASKNNPNTIMPPFGKYGILTADEVDKVVEYVYSL